MSGLKRVLPPPTDAVRWKRLMNLLYRCEEGRLFEWLRQVRAAGEEAERQKGRAA